VQRGDRRLVEPATRDVSRKNRHEKNETSEIGRRERTTGTSASLATGNNRLQAACNALRLSKKAKGGPRGKASLSRRRAGVAAVVKRKKRKKRERKEKRGSARRRERRREKGRRVRIKGTSINCPALCGKLRFNSRIQDGAAGKGVGFSPGYQPAALVYTPYTSLMHFTWSTTWRCIASRCAKSGRETAA